MREIFPVIIRGGLGKGKSDSIKSGGFILENLYKNNPNTTDLLIDKDGWHVRGGKIDLSKLFSKNHVFINTLSERSLEDFEVRKIIEKNKGYFVGSKTMPSLVSFNKNLLKNILEKNNIRSPRHIAINVTNDIESKAFEVFKRFSLPVIIKPARSENSHGISIARNFGEIIFGLKKAFSESKTVLVEEFIKGKEVSCTILENFRGDNLYTFPLGEIVRKGDFSDKDMKISFDYKTVFPARLSKEESALIKEMARKTHKLLGLNHYSRSDFIVSSRGIFILEINSSPLLDSGTLLHQSIAEGGLSAEQFINHLIGLAIERK